MLVNHLLLSGGGSKGILFIGVLDALEKSSEITLELDSITGVSIGAIIGTLYCINYTAFELTEIVLSQNLSKLSDVRFLNIIKKYGIDSGDNIVKWIQSLFIKKDLSIDITFQELYNITKIHLKIVTTNLTCSTQEIFEYEKHPDVSVITALRMSMSIPFVFNYVKYNECVYSDGCIIDNFPIHLFSNILENTLGLEIVTNLTKQQPDFSIQKYVQSILNCVSIQKKHYISDMYSRHTLTTFCDFLQDIDFSMSTSDKLKCIDLGYSHTLSFIHTYIH